MDIKLKPAGSGGVFVFPALPEKIKGSYSTAYQSFDIISKGNLKTPKGMNVSTFSWEGEFFGASKRNEPIVRKNAWKDPASCVRTLTNYMKQGKVLNLIVTDTWINEDVTISSFTAASYGAYGNIRYSIELAVKQPLQIYNTNEMKIATFTKKTTPRSTATKPTQRKYTVKQGDTLWGIARKYYGKGTQWQKIYNANKSTIEQWANRYRRGRGSDHGHWIYPGEVFVIP